MFLDLAILFTRPTLHIITKLNFSRVFISQFSLQHANHEQARSGKLKFILARGELCNIPTSGVTEVLFIQLLIMSCKCGCVPRVCTLPEAETEFNVSYSHAHVCNFHYNIFASRSLSFFILSHYFREPLCFLSISYYFAIGKPLPCLALLFVSSYCSSLSLPLPFPSIFQFNFASFAPIFFRSDFILIHCSLILIFSER